MREITLSEKDVAICKRAGKARLAVHMKRKTFRPLESGQDEVLTQILAVGGEVSFHRMFNLPLPQLVFKCPPYPKHDAKIAKGKFTVDIKTVSNRTDSFVYVYSSKCLDYCDIYAFMEEEFPVYRLLGFLLPSEIFIDANFWSKQGRQPCYRIGREKLRQNVTPREVFESKKIHRENILKDSPF